MIPAVRGLNPKKRVTSATSIHLRPGTRSIRQLDDLTHRRGANQNRLVSGTVKIIAGHGRTLPQVVLRGHNLQAFKLPYVVATTTLKT